MIDIYEALEKLVHIVEFLGYPGIFLFTFIESTFIPIPAEVTLVPAGYLAHHGKLNFYLVWIISIIGTVCGSLFNYWIAFHFGKNFLIQYGKYMFMKPEALSKIESFFNKHGHISVFTGRLLPGVKHFISFPAGLIKMPLPIFILLTTLGAIIWCFILLYIGYIVGENLDMISFYLKKVKLYITIAVLGLIAIYIIFKAKRK